MDSWMLITGSAQYSDMASDFPSVKNMEEYLESRKLKHNLLIEFLESVDAFNIKNGTVTINFDGSGVISSVEVKKHYRPK